MGLTVSPFGPNLLVPIRFVLTPCPGDHMFLFVFSRARVCYRHVPLPARCSWGWNILEVYSQLHQNDGPTRDDSRCIGTD